MKLREKELLKVIDATLSELVELRRSGSLAQEIAQIYLDTVYFYFQGDMSGIERCLSTWEAYDGEDQRLGLLCANLRLRIRRHDIDREQLKIALENANGFWAGEIYFLVAMSYSKISEHEAALKHYGNAYQTLEIIGAKRKAVKALFNQVVAESRIYPDKKLLADYHYIAKKAARVKEYGTAAVCLSNLSREYQKIGAFEVALKLCNQSLRFLKDDFGSIDYYLAIVHRSHLLFDMGRNQEAEMDYQQALTGDFPEVREALKVLQMIRGKNDTDLQEGSLTPTWKERLGEVHDSQKQQRLSRLEGELLKFIATSPRTKFEIIEHLYKEKIDFKLLEDRLKNLMSRLRKRRPGLVVLDGGKYRISDESFLENEVRREKAS